jgi:hypothetical protein
MEIEKRKLTKCKECNAYYGKVTEKYNGIVPVICNCNTDLEIIRNKYKLLAFYCFDGENLMYIPGSNIEESGGSIHVPLLYAHKVIAARNKNNIK